MYSFLKNYILKGNINPFHHYPFGSEPRADRETYLSIWQEAKKRQYPVIHDFEKASGFSIENEWFHKLALHTQVVVKESKICYQHGRLLYSTLGVICEKQSQGCINILETGTARGFSALCMARSLEDRKKEGKIITIDPLPHNIPMYWNCIDDSEGEKSRAQLLAEYSTLIHKYIWFLEGKSRDVLNKLELSRIHFAFLDGAHEYGDLKFEIAYLVPRQKKGDIIFFDDFQVNLFPGIVKAVKELESQGAYIIKTILINDQRGYSIAEEIS